jgi:hypothetical protein
MTAMKLDAHLSAPVEIDVCTACQAFWFDKYESLKLSPASTLQLMKLIGEHSAPAIAFPETLNCPRCGESLRLTNDLQRSTRFTYWRCVREHGRFIRFFEFLREKNFIRQLSRREIDELRQNVQVLNCSNCGAPIDLAVASACAHCKSPVSILDMKQPQQLLEQLRRAAEPAPVDPALPLELARARRSVEIALGPADSRAEWWTDVSATGLVQAGLSAVARWLRKSGM